MKVRIGEFDVECTVEEFEKLRKAKPEPPIAEPVAPRKTPVEQYIEVRWPGASSDFIPKPKLPTSLTHIPLKEKVVRGVKSLVVGTVGKYGQHGLTLPQIVTMSGLTKAQVKAGIYTTMYAKDGPVLLREEGGKYFCTQEGESYAIASNFGELKIVQEYKYMPKERT